MSFKKWKNIEKANRKIPQLCSQKAKQHEMLHILTITVRKIIHANIHNLE